MNLLEIFKNFWDFCPILSEFRGFSGVLGNFRDFKGFRDFFGFLRDFLGIFAKVYEDFQSNIPLAVYRLYKLLN